MGPDLSWVDVPSDETISICFLVDFCRFENVTPAVCHLSRKEVLTRLHFSPVPVFALGNWIPNVLYYWGCSGHNCGLDQAVFTSQGKNIFLFSLSEDGKVFLKMTSNRRMEDAHHRQEAGCQIRLADGTLGRRAL